MTKETESTPHVYEAIRLVIQDLSEIGISKERKNQQQGYAFRGIDDVYNVIAPLLAKHGLLILPRVISRDQTEQVTKSGGKLFYVVVQMEFDFISAIDGSKHTCAMFGEAMDSGDKATNKAESAAFKYVCLQGFCIPTQGDNDADATTHEEILSCTQEQKEEFDRLIKEGDALGFECYIRTLPVPVMTALCGSFAQGSKGKMATTVKEMSEKGASRVEDYVTLLSETTDDIAIQELVAELSPTEKKYIWSKLPAATQKYIRNLKEQ